MATPTLIPHIIRTDPLWIIRPGLSVNIYGVPEQRLVFSGTSKISGTVRVNGVLSKRRVFLVDRVTLTVIDITESTELFGEFEFTKLRSDRNYMIMADDHEQVYNAVIADWVKVDD